MGLHDWSLSAIDLWSIEESASIQGTVQAAKEQLQRVETELARADQLVVKQVLDEAGYVTLRDELRAQAARLRRTIAEPMAELDLWRNAIREAVTFGASALKSFQEGTLEQRRALVVKLYENFAYIDRKPNIRLHSPYVILDGPRPTSHLENGDDENLPSPSEVLLCRRKNARPRDARMRALVAWSG